MLRPHNKSNTEAQTDVSNTEAAEGGHTVLLHFTDKEKMKQRRQTTCAKSHSLIQNCTWNQSLLFLPSPVLFTPSPLCHTTQYVSSNDNDQPE